MVPPHMVYAVGWQEPRLVKVGTTSKVGRWRGFCSNAGGRLIYLQMFADHRGSYELEEWLHQQMHRNFRLAFPRDKAPAVPYLGGSGDGFRELFRADPRLATAMFASVSTHMPAEVAAWT